MLHKTRRFIYKGIFAVLVIWLTGFGLFWASISPVPEQPEQRTDAIVVLTGDADRIDTGVMLLQQGMAKKLFISGVFEGVVLPEIVRESVREASPDLCCIELGHTARSTFQNAEEVTQWAEKAGMTSLRLVTSDYHMPRSQLVLSRQLPDTITVLLHPVSSLSVWGGLAAGNLSPLRLRVTEFHKYLVSFVIA